MFFSGLALARALHPGGAQESRARYTAESLEDHFEDGMALAGALEGLEATLALTQTPASDAAVAGSLQAPTRARRLPRFNAAPASCGTISAS